MVERVSEARRAGTPSLVAIFHPDAGCAATIAQVVGEGGYRCIVLPNPAQGLRGWLDTDFALLLFNPFLGWEEPAHFIALARTIAAHRPMLVLTHGDRVEERLKALNAGGDDVVAWSEDGAEILARVASLLRRSRICAGQFSYDDLRIDLIDRSVERAGQPLRLPPREFDLLANLARSPDRAVARRTLLRAVWQLDFDPGTNRVEVHMSRLRAKVDLGFAWPMLTTVKGRGYALRSHRSAMLHPSTSGA